MSTYTNNLLNFSRSLPTPFDALKSKKVKVSSKYGDGTESTLCATVIKAVHAMCAAQNGSGLGAVGVIDHRSVAEYKSSMGPDTYLEVKTPLTTINVKYGKSIKTLPPKPFSSTDRMVRHVNELAGSLKDHERAVFLQVFQYRITEKKERLRSTHYEEVSRTIREAAEMGVEFWEVQMDFRPEGVSLYSVSKSKEL